MNNKIEIFNRNLVKTDLPNIRPGDTVLISQKIKDGDKDKIQAFEGLVIAKKHGNGLSATITVKKTVLGVGVEKIFQIHSPNIAKIEIKKRMKARRAKLYYLREAKGKKSRLKIREDGSEGTLSGGKSLKEK